MSRKTAVFVQPGFFEQLIDSLRIDEVTWAAMRKGLTRYPKSILIALIGSWTLLAMAIWVGGVIAIVGAVVGYITGANLGQTVLPGTQGTTGVLGAFIGFGAGFGTGFAAVMGTDIVIGGTRVLVALASGALLAALFSYVMVLIEPWIMYLRGYRPPSNREERLLNPILRDVAHSMRLTKVPQLLLCDTHTPGAWTNSRHIVLAKRILELPPDQLGGILVHELEHWRAGDSTGLLFVGMCALPIWITVDILQYFTKKHLPFVALVFKLMIWPYLVITRWMIGPMLASEGRAMEYAADRAAVDADYGAGLALALEQLSPFEQSRSGWEEVLNASHPPTEYRLEAIEDELKVRAGLQERTLPPVYRMPGKVVTLEGNTPPGS